MRRILMLLLALALLSPCLMGSVSAAETSGSCGTDLHWSFQKDTGILFISGTGSMDHFTAGEAPWYSIRKSIGRVEIAEGVASIGDYAFYRCVNMEEVDIPDSITGIGYSAFRYCDSLTAVTIPGNVRTISTMAFDECRALKSVVLQKGVSVVGANAFRYCTKLTSVALPDTITQIKDGAFRYCTCLPQISLPEGLTQIGREAFDDCRKLKQLTIPDSVTSVSSGAFSDCLALTTVVIGDGLTDLSADLFFRCESMTDITFGKNVDYYGQRAFSCCTSLENITFPANGGTICFETFAFCSNLKQLTFTGAVPSASDSSFRGCSALTEVRVADIGDWIKPYNDNYILNCNTLPKKIFVGDTLLTDLVIPKSETRIGPRSFYLCEDLTSVTFPNAAVTVYDAAFAGCTNLKDVYCARSESACGINILSGNEPLVNARWHYTEPTILTTPKINAFTDSSTGCPFIRWDRISCAEKYRIYRSTDGKNFTYLKSTKTTGVQDYEAEAGIEYYYKMRALDTDQNVYSPYSPVAAITCRLTTPDLSISVNDNGYPVLRWKRDSRASRLRIYRATEKDGTYEYIKTAIVATRFIDTDVTSGKPYYYKVRAIHENADANSAYSTVKSVAIP